MFCGWEIKADNSICLNYCHLPHESRHYARAVYAVVNCLYSVCLSACLSVTRWYFTTTKCRITQTTMHNAIAGDSSFPMPRISAKFRWVTPNGSIKYRWGRSKLALYLRNCTIRIKPSPHQQQCRSNVVECYKWNDSFDKVDCCFNIVAGVDEALIPRNTNKTRVRFIEYCYFQWPWVTPITSNHPIFLLSVAFHIFVSVWYLCNWWR